MSRRTSAPTSSAATCSRSSRTTIARASKPIATSSAPPATTSASASGRSPISWHDVQSPARRRARSPGAQPRDRHPGRPLRARSGQPHPRVRPQARSGAGELPRLFGDHRPVLDRLSPDHRVLRSERNLASNTIPRSCSACRAPTGPTTPSIRLPVTTLPMRANRCVTFGSFNLYYRVTSEVLDLWSRLLAAVPRSRLVIVSVAGGSTQARAAGQAGPRGHLARSRFRARRRLLPEVPRADRHHRYRARALAVQRRDHGDGLPVERRAGRRQSGRRNLQHPAGMQRAGHDRSLRADRRRRERTTSGSPSNSPSDAAKAGRAAADRCGRSSSSRRCGTSADSPATSSPPTARCGRRGAPRAR